MRLTLSNRSPAIGLCALLLTSPALGQSWGAGPSFPGGVNGREFAAGLNCNGYILAIGGKPFEAPPANNSPVHSLAPDAFSWQPRAALEGPVVRQGAGIDALGRIIVFGGVDGLDPGGDFGAAVEYSVIQGQRTRIAQRSAQAPHDNFAFATDPFQRIYSIGGGPGADATASDPNSGRTERYDALRDLWDVLAPMPTPVACAAAAYDGRGHILVFGGYNATATARTANVACYDIAGGVWSDTVVPDMPVPTSGHRAALGADGLVYVMGGEVGPVGAGTVVNTCRVLDPASGTWSAGPPMFTARRMFGVTRSDDGSIYVLGGTTGGGPTAAVERLLTPGTRSLLFDFNSGPIHRSLPLDWIVGGVTGHFSATGGGFSTQRVDTMGFTPAGFSGLCLYPNSVFPADLYVDLSHVASDFSILYSPQELGCDDSARMRATAYMSGVPVGTNTTTAHDPGTWPSATLRLHVPGGFDRIVVHYDARPPTCQNWGPIFLADNVAITLLPSCPADVDGDGFVTGDDFTLFVTWFEAGDLRADFDGDGFITGDDFTAFVTAFETGC